MSKGYRLILEAAVLTRALVPVLRSLERLQSAFHKYLLVTAKPDHIGSFKYKTLKQGRK